MRITLREPGYQTRVWSLYHCTWWRFSSCHAVLTPPWKTRPNDFNSPEATPEIRLYLTAMYSFQLRVTHLCTRAAFSLFFQVKWWLNLHGKVEINKAKCLIWPRACMTETEHKVTHWFKWSYCAMAGLVYVKITHIFTIYTRYTSWLIMLLPVLMPLNVDTTEEERYCSHAVHRAVILRGRVCSCSTGKLQSAGFCFYSELILIDQLKQLMTSQEVWPHNIYLSAHFPTKIMNALEDSTVLFFSGLETLLYNYWATIVDVY